MSTTNNDLGEITREDVAFLRAFAERYANEWGDGEWGGETTRLREIVAKLAAGHTPDLLRERAAREAAETLVRNLATALRTITEYAPTSDPTLTEDYTHCEDAYRAGEEAQHYRDAEVARKALRAAGADDV